MHGAGPRSEIEIERERAQPIADAIEVAGAQYDAERAEAAQVVAPVIAEAQKLIAAHQYMKAANLFDAVADEYRARHLRGDAEQWGHRAADCRSAAKHSKRLAKKGKGGR